MGAIVREFLEPETERTIRVREAPLCLPDGRTSKRLKLWIFEDEDGEFVCDLEAHRTEHLGELTEIELERVYILAVLQCRR